MIPSSSDILIGLPRSCTRALLSSSSSITLTPNRQPYYQGGHSGPSLWDGGTGLGDRGYDANREMFRHRSANATAMI